MSSDPRVHCTVLYYILQHEVSVNQRGWASIRIRCALEINAVLKYANMEQLALINSTQLFLALQCKISVCRHKEDALVVPYNPELCGVLPTMSNV